MSENRFITQLKSSFSGLFISILSIFFTIPVFVTFYKYLPQITIPIGKGLRIDHFLLFSLIFVLFYILIHQFFRVTYSLVLLFFLGTSISSLLGFYDFSNLYFDYASMLYRLNEQTISFEFEEKKDPFSREALIVYAIDYNNPKVREVASNWAVKNFSEYQSVMPDYKTTHLLSIYKEVRNRWEYVFDPKDEDLYVKASNTLKLLEQDGKLKGDCDDYSITMAALIKSVGGEVQLVRTLITNPDSTVTGHLYPEVKIGDKKDLEKIAFLIKNELFPEESKNKAIYYYIDKDENIWLNFDYFDWYPGGKYPSKVRVSVLKV